MSLEKKEKMTNKELRDGFIDRADLMLDRIIDHFKGTGNEYKVNEDGTWLDKALEFMAMITSDLEEAKHYEEQQ